MPPRLLPLLRLPHPLLSPPPSPLPRHLPPRRHPLPKPPRRRLNPLKRRYVSFVAMVSGSKCFFQPAEKTETKEARPKSPSILAKLLAPFKSSDKKPKSPKKEKKKEEKKETAPAADVS